MKLKLLSVIAAGALGALVSTAPAGAAAPTAPKLQRTLDGLVRAGAPGAIALARDGDRTLRLASGKGNLKTKAPIRPRDRFRMASITKSFVATVVLQLAGEGRLSLDDSVERWQPGLVPSGEAITVRQLLGMTAGLADYFDDPRLFEPFLAGDFGHKWSPQELVGLATAHPPKFAPGTSWQYSNTNYVVLGLIAEAAGGSSLADLIHARISMPLGLRATSFGLEPRVGGRTAHGYLEDGGRLRDMSALDLSFEYAAGAIVSTADDVARFYRALLSGRLVRPDLLRAMKTTTGGGAGYGLGLGTDRFPCGRTWGHSGATAGYSSYAFNSESGRHQLVLLVNLDNESFSSRTGKAVERALIAGYCG